MSLCNQPPARPQISFELGGDLEYRPAHDRHVHLGLGVLSF
jgi:hypothetical protein